jgi:hypothetical protein
MAKPPNNSIGVGYLVVLIGHRRFNQNQTEKIHAIHIASDAIYFYSKKSNLPT